MEGDPYARMLSVFRGENGPEPVRFYLGQVTANAPLAVRVGGVTLPAAALRMDERLTQGAQQQLRLTGAGLPMEVQAEQLEPALAAEDRVLLLTEDDQTFYVLMKVVGA